MNFHLAFDRRIHPWHYLKYNWIAKFRGPRRKRLAKKYGEPINAIGEHLHIYLTLRCNHDCYFCVNKQYNSKIRFSEKSGKDWLDYLNRLYNLEQIFIQGGEPFLHPDAIKILNGLDGFNVIVFTNLPHAFIEEIEQIKPKNNNIIFKISYHPLSDKRSIAQFVGDMNRIPVDIKRIPHLIDIPEVSYALFARGFRKYGIFLQREDVSLETENNKITDKYETVICNSHMEVVSPDMVVYRCLGLMMRQIEKGSFPLDKYNFCGGFQECEYYGLCGTCSTAKEVFADWDQLAKYYEMIGKLENATELRGL